MILPSPQLMQQEICTCLSNEVELIRSFQWRRRQQALQAKATKDKRSLLLNAIQELREKHENKFEALAHTHLVAVEYVRKFVSTPQFKMKREVSISVASARAGHFEKFAITL
jgi:hypothetical protein